MLSSIFILTVIIVILALAFDFINGFHDTANAIATSVSTRVLSLQQAVLMAAVFNFVGAFMNEKVAKTIGSGIVNPNHVVPKVLIAALLGAIIWNLITWYFGIPSSSSHALIGGLIGSAIAFQKSFYVVNWANLFSKVIIWLFLSPVIGFIIGFILMISLNWILKSWRPSTVSKVFSKAQIVSAMLMALNHGGNDAQKSMGIIAMALVSGGILPTFAVPMWVKISCALAMAIGTGIGGKKIIKTMGSNMARLAPVNGFVAETGAAAVIFSATMLNAPVSTTHIISSSIMGVAASRRISSVRWAIAKDIVVTWVLTIPTCGIISAVLFFIFNLI